MLSSLSRTKQMMLALSPLRVGRLLTCIVPIACAWSGINFCSQFSLVSLYPFVYIVMRYVPVLIFVIDTCILTTGNSSPAVCLNLFMFRLLCSCGPQWSVSYMFFYCKQDMTVARVPRTNLSLRKPTGSSF